MLSGAGFILTHPVGEFLAVASPLASRASNLTTEPLDPRLITKQLRAALDDAEAFVTRMPSEKLGLLFLQGSKVVQPDPACWKAIKPTPDGGEGIGRPVAKSPPPCSSVTTKSQARRTYEIWLCRLEIDD